MGPQRFGYEILKEKVGVITFHSTVWNGNSNRKVPLVKSEIQPGEIKLKPGFKMCFEGFAILSGNRDYYFSNFDCIVLNAIDFI